MGAANSLLPSLRQNLQLMDGCPGEDGSATWQLYDPARHQYFRLGPTGLEILRHWLPGETPSAMAGAMNRAGLATSAAEIAAFTAFLRQNCLTTACNAEDTGRLQALARAGRQGPVKGLLKNYLYFRIPLLQPDGLLEKALPRVSFLFSPWCRAMVAVMGLAGLFLVSRQWEAFCSTFRHFFNTRGLIVYALTLFGVKSLHELGHAFTAKRLGCRVPVMGVAFMVLYPMLYTDTTDAWRLPSHSRRLRIALAGIRVELALAMVATFAWSFLPPGVLRSAAFFVATVSWTTSLVVNASPFMRFDGYYALADRLGAENLQPRAFALARWRLREMLLSLKAPPPESLSRNRQSLFVGYAWASWLYRLFLFTTIAVFVYHMAFKALGILLFAVEMGWFVFIPIGREVRVWWQKRKDIQLTRRVALLAMAALGATALLIPWQETVSLPAVLKADKFTAVFPRENGRLEKILVKKGRAVKTGDPLFVVASPLLGHRLSVTGARAELFDALADRYAASARERKIFSVLKKKAAEFRAEKEGIRQRISRLVVRAPFEGTIHPGEGLHPGNWVSAKAPLAVLVSGRGARIDAYVEESDFNRIRPGDGGRFLAGTGPAKWIPVTVAGVDDTAVTELTDKALASVYGGPVAVRQTGRGHLRPEKGLYRVRLNTDAPSPAWATPGVARIRGRSCSLARRFWRQAVSVLIRETDL